MGSNPATPTHEKPARVTTLWPVLCVVSSQPGIPTRGSKGINVDFIAIAALAATGWVVGATAIALAVGRSIKLRDQSDWTFAARPALSRRR